MIYLKIGLRKQVLILLIAFLFVFLCSPLSFLIAADNAGAQSFFNLAKVMLFTLGIIYNAKAKVYCKMTLYVISYNIIYILSTLYNDGNLRTALNVSIGILGVYFWTEFFICKMPNKFLRAFLNYMVIMIVANLVTIILFPSGLSTNLNNGYAVRLIGIDNSLASILYPTVIVSYIQYYRGWITKKRVKILVAVVVITELLVLSATSIIGLIPILWGCHLLTKKNRNVKFDFNLKAIVLAYFIAFYFINISLSNSVVMTFVANIFHKSINFSGRTYIWARILEIFKNGVPLLGYGAYDKELLRTIYFLPANCHSFLFEILIDTGICGFVLYGYMFFATYKKAMRYSSNDGELSRCLLCYLAVILAMGIAEATSTYLANFVFLAIFYHSDKIGPEKTST